MNVESRAHRVLKELPNYQAQVEGRWLSAAGDMQLGALVGRYSCPENPAEGVDIFANGLVWLADDHRTVVLFSDVVEVELPDGKESDGLFLKTVDGRQVFLPVRGRRGRFVDSLAMLRFLDRVISDLQR
jgi:hypothetical protein